MEEAVEPERVSGVVTRWHYLHRHKDKVKLTFASGASFPNMAAGSSERQGSHALPPIKPSIFYNSSKKCISSFSIINSVETSQVFVLMRSSLSISLTSRGTFATL